MKEGEKMRIIKKSSFIIVSRCGVKFSRNCENRMRGC